MMVAADAWLIARSKVVTFANNRLVISSLAYRHRLLTGSDAIFRLEAIGAETSLV
jgi:hypothetical protein